MTGMTIPGGLLVAIEGIDGAGKSTLAAKLRGVLERVGAAVLVSKEPTAGPWGTRLRESAATGRLGPLDEVKFLLRDRLQHVQEVIAPALERGEVVILDRYYPSMVAYQGALGYPIDRLLTTNRFAPVPDLLLVLDVDPETGLGRIRARGDQPNHFETLETLARSREIFLALAVPNKVVIDAGGSEAEVFTAAQCELYLAIARKIRANCQDPVEAVQRIEPFLTGLDAEPA